mgnify:CR=1 FL=1
MTISEDSNQTQQQIIGLIVIVAIIGISLFFMFRAFKKK